MSSPIESSLTWENWQRLGSDSDEPYTYGEYTRGRYNVEVFEDLYDKKKCYRVCRRETGATLYDPCELRSNHFADNHFDEAMKEQEIIDGQR